MVRSVYLDVGGPAHLADFGGEGPAVVLVHGLGGAHTNWLALGPLLAERHRAVALDLVGFGRTPLAGRRARLEDNRRFLDAVLARIADGPVILGGNSMGGLLAMLEAAAAPHRVAGLVLVDPALPRTPRHPTEVAMSLAFVVSTLPGLGPWLARRRMVQLGPERTVQATLALCASDPGRIPREVVDAEVALMRERAASPDGAAAFVDASRSLVTFMAKRSTVLRLIESIRQPTLLLHGTEDRLVPVEAARAAAVLRPDWEFRILPGIGHVPQMEAAGEVATAIASWLLGPGAAAARAATRSVRLDATAASVAAS